MGVIDDVIPQPGEAAIATELQSISLAGVTLARVAQDQDLKVTWRIFSRPNTHTHKL